MVSNSAHQAVFWKVHQEAVWVSVRLRTAGRVEGLEAVDLAAEAVLRAAALRVVAEREVVAQKRPGRGCRSHE